MLRNDKNSEFSYFSLLYDLVIPKDNFFRILKAEMDFSFVNELLRADYCEKFGRPAKEPEFMFKLLLIQRLKNFSDRELIEEASQNLAYKYFLDLNPEDQLCDPSLLSKFRRKHIKQAEILDALLCEVLLQIKEKGLLKSTTVLVDATHTKSRSSKENNTQQLQRLSKNLRHALYKLDPEIRKKFPEKPPKGATFGKELAYTKKLVAVIDQEDQSKWDCNTKKAYEKLKKHLEMIAKAEGSMPKKGEWEDNPEIQSQVDPDAKTGYKSEDNSFFGYKSHLAMTGDRIITGIKVTSGEAHDGKQLPELIEQSLQNGIDVKEVLGDAAYGIKENQQYLEEKGITGYLRHPSLVSDEKRLEKQGMIYNKDADTLQCKAGHLAVKKTTSNDRGTLRKMYWFDVEKCKKCPYQKGCYQEGAKTRTFSIKEHGKAQKEALEKQETEEFREKLKERYKIEAKNGELKTNYGLEYCVYRSLFGMQLQTYLTAIAANLKRMVKMITNPVSKKAVLGSILFMLQNIFYKNRSENFLSLIYF